MVDLLTLAALVLVVAACIWPPFIYGALVFFVLALLVNEWQRRKDRDVEIGGP